MQKRINTYTWWLFCRCFFLSYSLLLFFHLNCCLCVWTRMSSLHSWVSMLVELDSVLFGYIKNIHVDGSRMYYLHIIRHTVMPHARYWYRLEFQSIQQQCWCICVQWFWLTRYVGNESNSHVCLHFIRVLNLKYLCIYSTQTLKAHSYSQFWMSSKMLWVIIWIID